MPTNWLRDPAGEADVVAPIHKLHRKPRGGDRLSFGVIAERLTNSPRWTLTCTYSRVRQCSVSSTLKRSASFIASPIDLVKSNARTSVT